MPPRVWPSVALALVVSCTAGNRPEAPAVETAVAPTVATPAQALVGWWRSDGLCLQLFANGDFELSLLDRGPKVQVLGTATLAADPVGAVSLGLGVTRIWNARRSEPCGEVDALGHWGASEQALGVTFTPGATAALTLRRHGDAQVELCGETCVTLRRATPALAGRFRRAGLEIPDRPATPWAAGELLELDLAADGHVWAGLPAGRWGTARGPVDARFVDADRFAVTFTPQSTADVPPGIAPAVLGEALAVGARRTWSARRLAGERLEVCGPAGHCATLERQFDAYQDDL